MNQKSAYILGVFILVAALIFGASAVLAQDGGDNNGSQTEQSSGVGDQLSEDAAQLSADTGDGFASAETLPALADDGPDARENSRNPLATFVYYRNSGIEFQPRYNTTTFSYGGNGCMYQTGGTDIRFQAPLYLPDGAEIKYVRLYYVDTSASNMTVWLTRYQVGQSNIDLTSVSSTGSSGYGTTLSPEITETVDNSLYTYILNFGTGVNSSANQICGIRVAYYNQTYKNYTPAILKDTP